jgi:hypothetical protein
MSTGKPRDPSKERLWRRMLRQWQRSDLSIHAFCVEHSLPEPSFHAWRRTIQQRDDANRAFLPVRVISEQESETDARHVTHQHQQPEAGLELVLGSGRVLRIGPAFDAPTLRRLLSVLEEEHS